MKTLRGKERFPLLSGGEAVTLDEVDAFVRGKVPAPVALLASVSLTNAQLLHLHSAPVTIIPAPGVGFGIVVISSMYQCFSGGSGPFTTTDSGPGLYYGANRDFGNADLANTPFLTDDCIYMAPSLMTNLSPRPGTDAITSFMNNSAVVLANPTTNMTDGADATGRIIVVYAIVPVA